MVERTMNKDFIGKSLGEVKVLVVKSLHGNAMYAEDSKGMVPEAISFHLPDGSPCSDDMLYEDFFKACLDQENANVLHTFKKDK